MQTLQALLKVGRASNDYILHEHLHVSNVTARWVPRMLSEVNKQELISACRGLLTQYHKEGKAMLRRIMTGRSGLLFPAHLETRIWNGDR